MTRHSILFFGLIFLGFVSPAQNDLQSFTVIPLGVKGGIDESNLSSYLIAAGESSNYICMDAGTLHTGLAKGFDSGIFKVPPSQVLRNYIKAYFISHPHLDHVAGLIINSPEDSSKTIYGLPATLDVLRDKYFTWQGWANFADKGDQPALNKYHYQPMVEGVPMSVDNAAMEVTAFRLSHGEPYQSTAFLIRHDADYLLYLGDTGADTIEETTRLHQLWEAVAPLIRKHALKGIFIEVSFPNEQPAKLLFGHLTPHLLMGEMKALAKLAGESEIKGLPVAIIHMKPNGDAEKKIIEQVNSLNSLGLKIIVPSQAVVLHF